MNRPLASIVSRSPSERHCRRQGLVGCLRDALKSDPQRLQADATRLARWSHRPAGLAACLPRSPAPFSRTQTSRTAASVYQTWPTGAPPTLGLRYSGEFDPPALSLTTCENLFSLSNWMAVKPADLQVVQARGHLPGRSAESLLSLPGVLFTVCRPGRPWKRTQAFSGGHSPASSPGASASKSGLIAITSQTSQEAKSARDTAAAAVTQANEPWLPLADQLSEITGPEIRLPTSPAMTCPQLLLRAFERGRVW